MGPKVSFGGRFNFHVPVRVSRPIARLAETLSTSEFQPPLASQATPGLNPDDCVTSVIYSNEHHLDSNWRHRDCVDTSHFRGRLCNHNHWYPVCQATSKISVIVTDALWEKIRVGIQPLRPVCCSGVLRDLCFLDCEFIRRLKTQFLLALV